MSERVREAIAEKMRRDPRVFLIGEDVVERLGNITEPLLKLGRPGKSLPERLVSE